VRTSVVLPTYNEAENLPRLVSALLALPLEVTVVVVDDNSPDGTGAIAADLARTHPGRVAVLARPGKRGLGSAYIEGFRMALERGVDAVVQMDADFSHDPQVIPVMSRCLASCDVVIGSRYVAGGSLDERWPLWRKTLSAFGNFYARSILRLPVHDVTTGYRMWRADRLAAMPLERIRSSGYVFLVEMAYVAFLMGYRLSETPIHFTERRWGRSKMSLPIQIEAAVRTLDVWWHYHDLRARRR
jgi:dolichol-phosphate mannosyltransferase